MAETELERAEKRFAQAKARVQALRNREATKQRKLDTRRKVILGGALVDLAARDDAAAAMLDRLIRNLAREQDQAAFVGWDWRAERGDENAASVADGSAAKGGGSDGGDAGNAFDAGGAEVRENPDQDGADASEEGARSAESETAPPLSRLRMPLRQQAELRRLRSEE